MLLPHDKMRHKSAASSKNSAFKRAQYGQSDNPAHAQSIICVYAPFSYIL